MLKKLIPRQYADTIYDINFEALLKKGYKGIMTDLDNTLVGAADPLATPELVVWLKQAASLGFKVVIISNNGRERVAKFATPLSIPYIYRAQKPKNSAFKKALTILDLDAQQCVIIGDQMLTDVLGGNRMGLYTILVKAISLKDEGFFTKINRRIEKRVLSRLKRKGYNPKEEQ